VAQRPKAWLAWSTGKDSAWALHTLRQRSEFDYRADTFAVYERSLRDRDGHRDETRQ
jgi:hypothetical protein